MRLWLADRTEEAFTCTLTLGEHVLQREAWVEDCLYGSSTTCAFEHNHGAYSGSYRPDGPIGVLTGEGSAACMLLLYTGQSPEGLGSRLVRRCQPSALLPHCIGLLTVQLQPERSQRRTGKCRRLHNSTHCFPADVVCLFVLRQCRWRSRRAHGTEAGAVAVLPHAHPGQTRALPAPGAAVRPSHQSVNHMLLR